MLNAVGGIYEESADRRLGAVLHAFFGLAELQAGAVEVTVNHRTARLLSDGLVPPSGMTSRVSRPLSERPRAGDRARRLREERQRQAMRAAGEAEASPDAAEPLGVDTAADPAVDPAAGTHGRVVRRQIRPGGPSVLVALEGVPEIHLEPPTEASRGLASVRSVYKDKGVTSTLLGWRPAPLGQREVTLLRLFHPAIAWAIQPVRPAPGGVTGAVLDLLLTGLPEKEIAVRLNRSTHTIHAHVKRVYRHYGVRSRSELIVSHFRHREDK
ncbi:MAG: helix-turn-helix transcriptional regulator [Tepidisphaeraceae bacterium]